MINGYAHSKFTVEGTDVDLYYSKIYSEEFIPDEIELKSIITGVKKYFDRGYQEFRIFVHLFKYESPSDKYDELESYRHAFGIFYPHSDGEPIKNIYNSNVLFFLKSITGYYLSSDERYDIAMLQFVSRQYVYMRNRILHDSHFNAITDGHGNKLIDGWT